MFALSRIVLTVVLTSRFVALGQAVKTTVCEVATNPEQFNDKLVSLRDRVRIAFEDFELSAAGCNGRRIDAVWLEYGKGPQRQPTTWCCGDMVPRDPLAVVQNSEFRKFHRYLTAETKRNGYSYQVTATLTGRFDAVPTETCPHEDRRCCPAGGYGHFGVFCARFVIRSVSDVLAEPTRH